MEAGDSGKLFIGGISWDTNEEQLTEYFGQFGEVAEAVIMRDRVTGRARGFGFIVFADSAVAERVILEKHMIDGRLVEAKKAVPRDDQSIIGSKTANSVISSPGGAPSSALARTRKIFVGGLPSSITEPDFKLYFEQFGSISDVVVMYDQTTQRPRGFGFITFDLEESVDRVLAKNTFHQLNGKMVEVKRAVPKELSPGPTRSPTPAGGVGRVSMNNSLLNFYGGYGGGSPGRYGGGGGGLNSSSVGGRNGLFAGYGSGSGLGFNRGPGMYMASRYGTGSGLGPTGGYGLGLNEDSRLGFARNNNLWGNGTGINTGTGTGLNPNLYSNVNMNMSMNMNNSSMVRSLGPFNNGGSGGNNLNWTGPVGGEMEGGNSNSFGLYGRNETGNGSFDNRFGARNLNPDLYGADPIYGGDRTWSFNTTELDGPIGSFNYMDNNNNYANNETSRGISS